MSDRIPFRARPMLATLVAEPFDKPGWVYEEKYDGFRMLAYKEGAHVQLISRNGKDNTDRFPRIAVAVKELPTPRVILDGEVVIVDRRGVSHFQLLQQSKGKPEYAVFDCLFANRTDLRHEPLSARRAVLETIVSSKGVLHLSRRLAKDGLDAFKVAKRRGYEGLVAKDLSSPYVETRSRSWLKVKVHQEDEFVIVGYTAPEGSRQNFGALLLGAYEDGTLHYVGKVGTGFDRKTLAALHKRFEPLVRRTTPLADPPRERAVTYLRPQLVAQIAYEQLTADNKLRQPVYLGLREDKRAQEVTLPKPSA